MYVVIAQKVPTLTSTVHKAKARTHKLSVLYVPLKMASTFEYCLNREIHAHKQVYMRSAIKGKKAAPVFTVHRGLH